MFNWNNSAMFSKPNAEAVLRHSSRISSMTEPALRSPRHRVEASNTRGEETRRRIIEVALRLFGERGYEGASTRDIATAAGVNAPALQYYFDNKEGVYRACAEYIAEGWAAQFEPVLDQSQATMDDPTASPEQVFQAFGRLLEGLADYQLLPDDAEHRRLFVLHEQVGHGPGILFELLDQSLRPRMGELAAQLIARYCGLDSRDSVLRMRVMMLFGQVMVFSVGRRSLVSKLGWEQMGPAEVAMIKKAVIEQCRVLMDRWRQDAGAA
jgi:TetR/AcrR family transcriptional regulator, regulator of cefoperazone and chloramphenicol sensitivity